MTEERQPLTDASTIADGDTHVVALIGCGSAKIDLDDGEAVAAGDLYDSVYFGLKQTYGKEICDEYLILSAKHGVLPPNEQIESYDASLTKRSDSYIGDEAKQQWGVNTTQELEAVNSGLPDNTIYVMLAGEDYVQPLEEALNAYNVEFPFRATSIKGIGDQMGWLRTEIDKHRESDQTGFSDF